MELVRHTKTVRVKNGKEQQYKPMAKHAMKVHVWAAISKCGATKVCIFNQIMNAEVYVDILDDFLVPFISTKFPDGHCFMQAYQQAYQPTNKSLLKRSRDQLVAYTSDQCGHKPN